MTRYFVSSNRHYCQLFESVIDGLSLSVFETQLDKYSAIVNIQKVADCKCGTFSDVERVMRYFGVNWVECTEDEVSDYLWDFYAAIA